MSVWQEIITTFEMNLGQKCYDIFFNWETLPNVFSLDREVSELMDNKCVEMQCFKEV